jgi:hypothetical protein
MAGIRPAAVPDNNVTALGKDVNNLALAFVAPLQPDNANVHSLSSSYLTKQTIMFKTAVQNPQRETATAIHSAYCG